MIANDMIFRDHIFQYTPSSLGSVLGNTVLGTVFLDIFRPWEISRSSGDVFPNTSLLSAVYGYNIFFFKNFLSKERLKLRFCPVSLWVTNESSNRFSNNRFSRNNLSTNIFSKNSFYQHLFGISKFSCFKNRC